MLLQAASLFGLAFVAAIAGILPLWATCIYYTAQLGWSPAWVGMVAATGQCAGYVVLYTAGTGMMRAWPRLARRVDAARETTLHRLSAGFLPTTLSAAILGVPPMLAIAAIAPAFEVGLLPLVGVAFPGRFIRFAVAAGAGGTLTAWLFG